MNADAYNEAIRAGAAAITAPYTHLTDEDVHKFIHEFPTLAAARAIDAALPHLRTLLAAEVIPSGPCPATDVIPRLHPDGSPWPLHALCDLRAGHDGQHEAEDEQWWGYFRWSDGPVSDPINNMCRATRPDTLLVCTLKPDHRGYHIDGFKVWDGCGNVIADD